MQASALSVLERLRTTRNVLVHQGLAADERFTDEAAIEAATLVQTFARLEWIAAQVDELDFDSRQNALVRLIMEPAVVDRSGSTVILSASKATSEYIDHGLRLLRLDSTTLSDLRDRKIPLRTRLDTAGAILILTDPQLKGLDLTGARQVINYDLPSSPQQLVVRSTRLRSAARPWQFWTLLPTEHQLSDAERLAVTWGPYLAAHPQQVG
jgi:superfamily II DNA/RNA helicase